MAVVITSFMVVVAAFCVQATAMSLGCEGNEDGRNEDRQIDDLHVIALPPLVAALEIPRQTIPR